MKSSPFTISRAQVAGLIGLSVLCMVGCGGRTMPDVSEPSFTQGTVPGHEVITWWAVDKANRLIGERLGDEAEAFPVFPVTDRGGISANLMVQGSFATDFTNMESSFSLNEFYGVAADLNMAYDGGHQDQHFMRGFSDDGVQEALPACQSSLERITAATREAVVNWSENRDRSMFFLGHSLHIIQDSFTRAHARRSDDYKEFEDICIYIKEVPGVCRHATFDPNDYAFYLFCDKKTWNCLKPEARKAAEVSAGYLFTVAALLHDSPETADAQLDEVLHHFYEIDGDDSEFSGYFRCNTL